MVINGQEHYRKRGVGQIVTFDARPRAGGATMEKNLAAVACVVGLGFAAVGVMGMAGGLRWTACELPAAVAIPVRLTASWRLAVRNILFSDDPTYADDPPFIYADGDLDDSPTGIAGQNMETPAKKRFKVHSGVHYLAGQEARFYDPCYGKTASDEAEYLQRVVAALGKKIDGDLRWFRVPWEGQQTWSPAALPYIVLVE